jgi:RecA-family ATPase
MDRLAPPLIRRAKKGGYAAVIIDPIYKVITGDENSADQMAHFCNQFDKVCNECGCAVIYCHHHSKGAQGAKRSMDRASGSGVFARDPDALLDMIELPLSEQLRRAEEDRAACAVMGDWLKRFLGGAYGDTVSDDDEQSRVRIAQTSW